MESKTLTFCSINLAVCSQNKPLYRPLLGSAGKSPSPFPLYRADRRVREYLSVVTWKCPHTPCRSSKTTAGHSGGRGVRLSCVSWRSLLNDEGAGAGDGGTRTPKVCVCVCVCARAHPKPASHFRLFFVHFRFSLKNFSSTTRSIEYKACDDFLNTKNSFSLFFEVWRPCGHYDKTDDPTFISSQPRVALLDHGSIWNGAMCAAHPSTYPKPAQPSKSTVCESM